jgi:glycosyltransferase involved in cell wall biosynthesis
VQALFNIRTLLPGEKGPYQKGLPFVSVVTVVRNDEQSLNQTLKSVQEQTYPCIEHIIIDGSDAPMKENLIPEGLSKKIIYMNEPDDGIYDAMNKGLLLAKGAWVQFLNAGDIYSSRDVLMQILAHDSPAGDVIYGDSIADYERYKVYQRASRIDRLWHRMPCRHQAMLFRNEILEGLYFNRGYRISADYEMICAIYSSHGRFVYVPVPLVVYGTSGLSNQKMYAAHKEQYRISRKFFQYTSRMYVQFQISLALTGLIQFLKTLLPVRTYLYFLSIVKRKQMIHPG